VRHGLGSKTVEQELTEGTEVLCYLLFYEFGCGYAALSPSVQKIFAPFLFDLVVSPSPRRKLF